MVAIVCAARGGGRQELALRCGTGEVTPGTALLHNGGTRTRGGAAGGECPGPRWDSHAPHPPPGSGPLLMGTGHPEAQVWDVRLQTVKHCGP